MPYTLRQLCQVLLAALFAIPCLLWFLAVALLGALFGRWQWQAPGWLRGLGRGARASGQWLRRRPLTGAAALLGLVLLGLGASAAWHWYQNLPQPYLVEFSVEAPAVTDYSEQPPIVDGLSLVFEDSVAPLEQLGKRVEQGLSLSPAISGEWQWASESKLVFRPDGDWPVGQPYQLKLAKDGLFAPGVMLPRYDVEFSSAPFQVQVASSELYQDPSIASLKKLVTTLRFSHPVNPDSVRKRVAISLDKGLEYRDKDISHAPEIRFDKKHLRAFVHSQPLATPLETVSARLTLERGSQAQAGGEAFPRLLSSAVSVPGRFQLTFTSARIQFVDNNRDEPEPILLFDSSSAVADEVIASAPRAWLLPEKTADGHRHWNQDMVTEALLQRAEPVRLEHVPSVEPLNRLHAFKFKVPPGRFLYVSLPARIEAVGGYLTRAPSFSLLQMPEYPRVLKFLAEGSLLSLNGTRQLGFMSRGIDAVDLEVARLLPNQLHHLVDQSSGSFARPRLGNDYFDLLVERQRSVLQLPAADPAQTLYDHIDLTAYLNHDGGRRGVFVVRVAKHEQGRNPEYSPTFDYYDEEGDSDLRFILVTDLGIIAKRSADGSHDVFVQSISSGLPVANARVQIIGRNGLPVAEGLTDGEGRAHFAKLDELRRERTPLLYQVSLGDDLSFLPVNRHGHRLDLSRFNTGGLSDDGDPSRLSAYLFTDRGLYRPGETAQIGSIVRSGDWQGALAGLPVELMILDPRGLTVQTRRFKLDASGFSEQAFVSSEVAAAGEYTATLSLIGDDQQRISLGETRFKVREFEPDRMKVSVSLAAQPVLGWIAPDAVQAKVDALHLFGAPASDRRVAAELHLSPGFAAFARYPDHRFRISNPLAEDFSEELADVQTDANGQALLELGLNRFANSTYQLQLLARVFEAGGGRNVAAQDSLLVSSAPWLVGVKVRDSLDYVRRGATREIHWQAVGPDLAPLAVQGLQTELVEHRYLSVLIKQSDGTYKYESRRKDISLASAPLQIAAEGASQRLETGTPGEFSLRLKDASGALLNEVRYSVAGSGNASRSLERNAELQLSLNKASYASGEEIELSIRAPYTGAGLITIERDRVYAQQWFKADSTSSVQRIRLPEGIEGNAYVNVQFVRDPSSSEVYMSPLSYAVAPFAVNLDARRQPLAIQASEQLQPGETFEIRLTSERAGKVVVYAVDEGILQVARYQSPDPLGHFFRKRALQVDTSQILDLILPEFSLALAQAAAGGGDDGALAAHLNPFKRKGKPPVAWWSGLIDLPVGETRLSYRVPDSFNGRLRWFAVSVDDSRIGVHEGAAEVRGPLVITPNVPAFVAPGDEFMVTAGIFSNLAQASSLRLRLETDQGLKLLGDSADLQLQPGRETQAEFRIKALENLGSSTLRFAAELPDGRRVQLAETTSVRPAVAHRVQLSLGRMQDATLELSPTRQLFPQLRRVELAVGSSPLVWSQGLANYLADYSYSCTEQLVSKAMPMLVWNSPADGLPADASRQFDAIIRLLRERQNQEGGFGLWGASPQSDPFASSHAADFLIEARERGYEVPDDLLNRANQYLSQLAGNPSQGFPELRVRAYAAYLLTRQGVVLSGPLADIRERYQTYFKDSWEQDIGAAYLAASYQLLKQDKLARALFAKVPWRSGEQAWLGDHPFYDALVHDAERLHLLARHFPEQRDKLPAALLDQLGRRLADKQYNSLSAALLLRALDDYGQQQDASFSAGAKVGGQTLALSLSGKPPRADVPLGSERLLLSKEGALPGFYLLSEAGFDRGTLNQPLRQGMEISRDYLSLDGKPLQKLAVGEEFLVRLRLRATERNSYTQVALVDLLPGGAEPVYHNPLPVEDNSADEEHSADEEEQPQWQSPLGEQPGNDWQAEHVDVRDDRVVVYGGLESTSVRTLVYRARAVNAGSFVTPPPYAEGIYQRRLQARGSSGTLEIVKP